MHDWYITKKIDNMTKKEKIRAEIERRMKLHKDSLTNPIHQGFGLQKVINAKISELTYLLSFIDSMQKEPVSDDLKKEIENFLDYSNLLAPIREVELIACYFANWQKEQMLAKAIDAKARFTMSVPSICISLPLGVNVGDKVKVIVIKED